MRWKNNDNNNKEIRESGVGLEGLATYNPKLKYTHAVTHDATELKDPCRPTACCSHAVEILKFRLIRSESIARKYVQIAEGPQLIKMLK